MDYNIILFIVAAIVMVCLVLILIKKHIDTMIQNTKKELVSSFTNSLEHSNQLQQQQFSVLQQQQTRIESRSFYLDEIKEHTHQLQQIFQNKKYRGQIGEVALNQLLESFYSNRKQYQLQAKLSNQTIVDALVFTYTALGNIAIDAKFPLENYLRFMKNEVNLSVFRSDLQQHIKAISSKYILSADGIELALMFVPSDVVYSDICLYLDDVLIKAYPQKVFVVSPSTLIPLLNCISILSKEGKRNHFKEELLQELTKLQDDYRRFEQRYDNIVKDFERLEKNLYDLSISVSKIKKCFYRIENLDFEAENENSES